MSLTVYVKTRLPNVANGWYDVEFTADRLFLRRPGDLDAVTILVGSTALYEAPAVVRVVRDSQELLLTVSWLQSNRQRVAADLAQFISGVELDPIPTADDNKRPQYLVVLAFLPMFIGWLANWNLLPSLVGAGLTWVCVRIARSDTQSVERRLTKILVISVTSIAAYTVLLAYLFYEIRRNYYY